MNAPPPSAQVELNPWKRSFVPEYQDSAEDSDYFCHFAAKRAKFLQHPTNTNLDINIKKVALKASPSVVALVSYSGDNELSQGCGTIIEVNENNMVIVLTSANLIRRPTEAPMGENALADDLKVRVHGSDEKSYEGEIYALDFHYNLLAIIFKSDSLLPAAKLRLIDDGQSLQSVEEKSYTLRPHSVKLEAGEPVIAVGRYCTKPFDLMAASGCFCLERSSNDCKELFMATCNITRRGEGAPLINLSGEVIGISFYDHFSMMPFLPINVARKWWEYCKIHGESRHLYLGFEATGLYVAPLSLVERVIRSFPGISKGIIVEKVKPGSSAEAAGLHQDDVIVRCDGKNVENFLELWEVMWDKVGSIVELVVARAACCSFLSLNMMVGEARPDELNSWPRRSFVDHER